MIRQLKYPHKVPKHANTRHKQDQHRLLRMHRKMALHRKPNITGETILLAKLLGEGVRIDAIVENRPKNKKDTQKHECEDEVAHEVWNELRFRWRNILGHIRVKYPIGPAYVSLKKRHRCDAKNENFDEEHLHESSLLSSIGDGSR